MSDLPTAHSRLTRHALVEELLYGFDICDEDTREFLGSVIASGRTPQADLEELQQLSLMRGVEEWDMLFECAEALREEHGGLSRADGLGVERSLVPFLETVIGGGVGGGEMEDRKVGKVKGVRNAKAPRKNGLRRGVSHFWGEVEEAGEKVGVGQRRQEAYRPRIRGEGNSQEIPPTAGTQAEGIHDFREHVPEPQGIASTSPPPSTEASDTRNGVLSGTAIKESLTPVQLSLPSRPARANPELTRDTERPVKATGTTRSPFFCPLTPTRASQQRPEPVTPSTKKKPRPPRGTVSCLPIPPLSATHFGLIQEELADDPFRLLIAVTFLIRTAGKAAIPVFRQLMALFPTPEALAAADPAEIIALIHPLGLSAVRCAAIQKYARLWIEKPPSGEVRYGVKNYSRLGDGRHVRVGEEFGPEDRNSANGGGGRESRDEPVDAVADARERAVGCAWELGHLTQGPYALDSWRIFCRDVLLGRSGHWTGSGEVAEFQPEWMRVLPRDKELRACLRWMWYVSLPWPFPFCRPWASRSGIVWLEVGHDAWAVEQMTCEVFGTDVLMSLQDARGLGMGPADR